MVTQYSIIKLYISSYSYEIGVILQDITKYLGYKILSEIEILNIIGEDNYNFTIHEAINNIEKKLFEMKKSEVFLEMWEDTLKDCVRISKPEKIDIKDNDYGEKLEMLFKVFV